MIASWDGTGFSSCVNDYRWEGMFFWGAQLADSCYVLELACETAYNQRNVFITYH